MGESLRDMLREFVDLNARFAGGGLPPALRARWEGLACSIDAELLRREAEDLHLPGRRRTARARLRLPLRFLASSFFGQTRTRDLSSLGCSIAMHESLKTGEEVEMTVWLPLGLGTIHPTGRIRWSYAGERGTVAGIEFACLDDIERRLLMTCVLGTRVASLVG